MVDPRAGPDGHCAIRLAPLHCELLVIAKYHGVRMSSLQLVRVSLTSTPPPNLALLPRSFPVRDRDVNSLVSNPSGNAYWVRFNWCTRHLPGRIFRCTRHQKLGVFHTFPAMALKGASYTFPKGVAYTGPSNHSAWWERRQRVGFIYAMAASNRVQCPDKNHLVLWVAVGGRRAR
jgi:hypothetical protein